MELTEEALANMIEEASAALDGYYPDWRDKVNISTLDMHDPSSCIVGQVAGSWWTGPNGLRGLIGLGGPSFSQTYGRSDSFTQEAYDRGEAAYAALTDAWRAYLS